MKPEIASKLLLKHLLDWNEIEKLPNQEYLEFQLDRLQKYALVAKTNSQNPEIPPRLRARARDMEQNTKGLIAGIQFAIAFWYHKDQDLLKIEKLEEIVKKKSKKQVDGQVNWRL
jgi:hypothetical protein